MSGCTIEKSGTGIGNYIEKSGTGLSLIEKSGTGIQYSMKMVVLISLLLLFNLASAEYDFEIYKNGNSVVITSSGNSQSRMIGIGMQESGYLIAPIFSLGKPFNHPDDSIFIEGGGTGYKTQVEGGGTGSQIQVEGGGTGSQIQVEGGGTGSQIQVEGGGTGYHAKVEGDGMGNHSNVDFFGYVEIAIQDGMASVLLYEYGGADKFIEVAALELPIFEQKLLFEQIHIFENRSALENNPLPVFENSLVYERGPNA